jgi:hypothetical protein
MAQLSEEIVHGVVVATESRWTEDRSSIVTDVRIRVVEAVKGAPAREIVVTELGGVVGALRVEVAGVAAMRSGQEAVFFLSPDARGARQVVGLGQGRLDVRTEPDGAKTVRLSIASSETDLAPSEATQDGAAQDHVHSEPAPRWRALPEFLTELRTMTEAEIER